MFGQGMQKTRYNYDFKVVWVHSASTSWGDTQLKHPIHSLHWQWENEKLCDQFDFVLHTEEGPLMCTTRTVTVDLLSGWVCVSPTPGHPFHRRLVLRLNAQYFPSGDRAVTA